MTFSQDQRTYNELRDRQQSYLEYCLFEKDDEVVEMADRIRVLKHGKDTEAYLLALARLGSEIVQRLANMSREIEVMKEDQDEADRDDAGYPPYPLEEILDRRELAREAAKDSRALKALEPTG